MGHVHRDAVALQLGEELVPMRRSVPRVHVHSVLRCSSVLGLAQQCDESGSQPEPDQVLVERVAQRARQRPLVESE
eukprot:4391191-Alexandrium_andersonii.AAC.1